MKSIFKIVALLAILFCRVELNAQEIDPALSEVWEPVPQVVTPGKVNIAPSDAIVLFDGSNLDQWQNPQFEGEEVSAEVIDGEQSVVWEEAGNRLHAQKALLEFLLTQ